jgi:hypothetical protein
VFRTDLLGFSSAIDTMKYVHMDMKVKKHHDALPYMLDKARFSEVRRCSAIRAATLPTIKQSLSCVVSDDPNL